jgi:hypothetical protein
VRSTLRRGLARFAARAAFTLEPGGSSTRSNAIQLPFGDPASELPSVQLQAVVQSPSPGPAVGNSATWPMYRTPPVELTLGRARAAQQLLIHWEATRQQFSVRVTDANTARVEGVLLVAWMWATSAGGKTLGRLQEDPGPAGRHPAAAAIRRKCRRQSPGLGCGARLRDGTGPGPTPSEPDNHIVHRTSPQA